MYIGLGLIDDRLEAGVELSFGVEASGDVDAEGEGVRDGIAEASIGGGNCLLQLFTLSVCPSD